MSARDCEPVDRALASALVERYISVEIWRLRHGDAPVCLPDGRVAKPPLGPVPYLPPTPCQN